MIIFSTLILSCSKIENQHVELIPDKQTNVAEYKQVTLDENKQDKITVKKQLRGTKETQGHIFYATWDGWGHGEDCSGWGLCQFISCLFCCTDENGDIVDCDSGVPIYNSGTIDINSNSSEGFMTINLNPNDSAQNVAINNQKPLYIDSDLQDSHFTLHKGTYQFNSEIGNHGGYSVNVTKK